MHFQAYNMIAQRDSQIMTNLGEAARYDSQIMKELGAAAKEDSGAMRTIAVVSMFFLPPTFISVRFCVADVERLGTDCDTGCFQHELFQLHAASRWRSGKMVSFREVLGVLGVCDTLDGSDFGYLGPATAMDTLIFSLLITYAS